MRMSSLSADDAPMAPPADIDGALVSRRRRHVHQQQHHHRRRHTSTSISNNGGGGYDSSSSSSTSSSSSSDDAFADDAGRYVVVVARKRRQMQQMQARQTVQDIDTNARRTVNVDVQQKQQQQQQKQKQKQKQKKQGGAAGGMPSSSGDTTAAEAAAAGNGGGDADRRTGAMAMKMVKQNEKENENHQQQQKQQAGGATTAATKAMAGGGSGSNRSGRRPPPPKKSRKRIDVVTAAAATAKAVVDEGEEDAKISTTAMTKRRMTTKNRSKGGRRVTISGDGPSVAIIPRQRSSSGKGSDEEEEKEEKKKKTKVDRQQKEVGGTRIQSARDEVAATSTEATTRRPPPPPSILRKSKTMAGLGTSQEKGAAAGSTAIRPIGGTAGVLARLAAGSSASASGLGAPSAKALASTSTSTSTSRRMRRAALGPSTAGNACTSVAPPDGGNGGGRSGRVDRTPSASAASRNKQTKARGRARGRSRSSLGADAILPSPSTNARRAQASTVHGDNKEIDDELTVDTEAEETTLRSTKKRLSFATSLPLAASGMDNDIDNDDDDDDFDAAVFADDESEASSSAHVQNRPSSSTAARPRPKRPTPMDLAWRQVALDEKEGRLPEYVAETETEKRMERMSERARRDGTELRRIRQLNREGNEDAYLDALGEYLSSHNKERRRQKNAKKGKNAPESNKKRRKMGRSSVSSSRRSGLGDESSDASSSSSESRSSIASEKNMRKTKNVDSSEVKEAEMSVELSSSASSGEEETEESVAPLGSMLQLKWRGVAELQSIANEHRLFVIQYKATYHNSNKSIRDATMPSLANDRSSAKIRPSDLIIKVRSAHPLNGSSETICSFANWTLPGTSNSSKRKSRGTDTMAMSSLKPMISESVRRGISVGLGGSQMRGGIQAPPLFLDRDLSFEDKARVRSFLTDASPGSTPLQFFSRQVGSSKSSKSRKPSGRSPTRTAHQDQQARDKGKMVQNVDSSGLKGSVGLAEDIGTSIMSTGETEAKNQPMEEDEESNAERAQIDELEYASTVDADVVNFSSKNKPSSRNVSSSSIGRRCPVLRKPLDARPSSIVKSASTADKKETIQLNPSANANVSGASDLTPRTRTARAKRKHEEVGTHAEGPPNVPNRRTYESRARKRVCHRPITFSCNELPGSDAGTASCFCLIEGVGGGKSELENVDNHPLDRYLPFRGKIMETPGAVAIGNWTSVVVEDEFPSRRSSSSRGILRDTVADLRGIRIELRHEDAKKGPLKALFGSDLSLTFSVFSPRKSRVSGFKNQGVLDEDEIKRMEDTENGRKVGGPDGVPFIGSISLALHGGGFHSMSQQNSEGRKLAEDLLDGVRLLADKESFQRGRSDFRPLCNVDDKDETVIGVSFPCHIECVDDYWVILAQDDESQAIIGVDIVFEDPNLILDDRSTALESATTMSSISESTRFTRTEVAALSLTDDNLLRHDREQNDLKEEEEEDGHDERRYDDEVASDSSSEVSSLASSRTPFVGKQGGQTLSQSSKSSCHDNEMSQGSDRLSIGDDLVTLKYRDEVIPNVRRTGTTKSFSSTEGGSDGSYPAADDDEFDLAHAQQDGDEKLCTSSGNGEEASRTGKDRTSADFHADIVAIGRDSEPHDNVEAGVDGVEKVSEQIAKTTCHKGSTGLSSNKKSPGSAVSGVEWAEDVDHSGALAHELSLARETAQTRRKICGGHRGENETQCETTGPGSKVLEVYEVSRGAGSMGQVQDSPAKPGVTAVRGTSPDSSSMSTDILQESSVETVEYPMPMDTPPVRSQRKRDEPMSNLLSNVIRPPRDNESLSSCDWEVTRSYNDQDIEEEVFSTPDQPCDDAVVPDETNPRSTPSSTPLHAMGVTRYEASDPSPKQPDLANVLDAEAKMQESAGNSISTRPWMVHSTIFGAQDVSTPSSSFSPLREDAMVQEPVVLANRPFYWESPEALSSTSIEALPAHSLVYGGQDSDYNGIISPQNPALSNDANDSTTLATMPFFLESTKASQAIEGEDTNSIGFLPESPRPPRAFHSLLFGQDETPQENRSPQSSILRTDKEPTVLALTPFFFESPTDTAKQANEGCISKDARTIVFGAQDQGTYPRLQQGCLTGSEPIFRKEPGNILARPIFMSTASYDEEEEYDHSPLLHLREILHGGDENESVDSPIDTTQMDMEREPDCLLPFFIEFEGEAQTEGKKPRKRRGSSEPWSLRYILPLLGVALLLTPASTPPPAAAPLRASSIIANGQLNQCLLPSHDQTPKIHPGNLRSF